MGATLGNPSQRAGFAKSETEARPVLPHDRRPRERAEFLRLWTELLLSGSAEPVRAGKSGAETAGGLQQEPGDVATDPDALIFHAFVEARGRTA
ncbi:MAG: hypothetical protein VXW31_01050 [Planctomycetota bacterium]|nr:hypothetical protein [Planctomycetota bacterium]